jgi:threonine dehydrogenase-like Zn-dependent dehydrogenase
MHGDSTNIDRHVLPTVGGLDPTDRDRDTRRARHIDRLLTAGALERRLSRQVPTVRRHHGGHSVTSGLIRTRPLRNLAAFAASADRETAGLHSALRSTEPEGTCTSTAIYFADTPLPLLDMYTRGITFRTGRVNARAVIPDVLDLITGGRLRPELVSSAVIPWEEADTALTQLAAKTVVVR